MIDWHTWVRRWDLQQANYIPEREQRFDTMLEACARLLPDQFVALDLACGPGAISQRLLTRFPHARVVALDYNPILMELGKHTVEHPQQRLRWQKANLAQPEWVQVVRDELAQFEQTSFDAVLTTTAMHWLAADVLTHVYTQVGGLVREGGVFLNGDHLAFPPHMPAFRQLMQHVKQQQQAAAFSQAGNEDYGQWWAALLDELRAHTPAYDNLIAEYERNEAARVRNTSEPVMALHEAALLNAGFTQLGTIWQQWDDRVLLAIKGLPMEALSN